MSKRKKHTNGKTKNGDAAKVEHCYRHVGRVILAQREKRELVQKDLAVKLGWSRPTICLLEQGKQRLMMHDLPKLAEALGVRVLELIPPEWQQGG